MAMLWPDSEPRLRASLSKTRKIHITKETNPMEERVIEGVELITPEQIDIVLIEIERSGGHGKKHHPHLVTVTVDTLPKQVRPGRYVVNAFKRAVGVDPNYELEEVVNGKLVPLADDAHIHIKGGESFVSHVRGGASS
jgi:hypothetical protein